MRTIFTPTAALFSPSLVIHFRMALIIQEASRITHRRGKVRIHETIEKSEKKVYVSNLDLVFYYVFFQTSVIFVCQYKYLGI